MTRSTRSSARAKSSTTASAAAAPKTKTTRKKQAANKAKKHKASAPATASANQPWHFAFTKGDEEYDTYMREEWGFEKRGDRALFEKLCLEGAQSGLSWLTILRKRDAYRRVFHNFDPSKVATMTEQDVEEILQTQPVPKDNTRDIIVRHRGKIEATINNAKCLLQMQKEEGSPENALDAFLWSFVQDKPILNRWGANFTGDLSQCPSKNPESEAMSKALKKMGWKFVGPTTCYAMMQSVGMVIDHPVNSPEWKAAHTRLQERPGGYQDVAQSTE